MDKNSDDFLFLITIITVPIWLPIMCIGSIIFYPFVPDDSVFKFTNRHKRRGIINGI